MADREAPRLIHPHISASLLAADFARLGEEVQRAVAGGVDSLHFDFMDGHYVPNLALSPDHLRALRSYTDLPFHVHLELSNPDQVVSEFTTLEAEMLIFQEDTCPNVSETLRKARRRGFQVGLGVSPQVRLDTIKDVAAMLDMLLILGVQPGFGGQTMAFDTPRRIAAARALIDQADRSVSLAADGGVNLENARSLLAQGADTLIIGTALFESPDLLGFTRALRAQVSHDEDDKA